MNDETPSRNETITPNIAENISIPYLTVPFADHAIRKLSQENKAIYIVPHTQQKMRYKKTTAPSLERDETEN